MEKDDFFTGLSHFLFVVIIYILVYFSHNPRFCKEIVYPVFCRIGWSLIVSFVFLVFVYKYVLAPRLRR